MKDAIIELDKIKSDCCFIEIEASERKIQQLAKQLGLDWKHSTTKGYQVILKELGT